MPEPEKIGSIEISEDLEFEHKSWRVQRIAWMVMLGIAVAGVLGVFGGGPLSSATLGDAESGPIVRYERFVRSGGDHVLELEVPPSGMSEDSTVRIWISREWLTSNRVTAITPRPSKEEIHPDRILYHFDAGEAASAVTVRFWLDAVKPGVHRWRGGVEDGSALSFRQLAYP